MTLNSTMVKCSSVQGTATTYMYTVMYMYLAVNGHYSQYTFMKAIELINRSQTSTAHCAA